MPSMLSSVEKRRRQNIKRFPVFIQRLLTNKEITRQWLELADLGRPLVGMGISPTPGFGLRERDAGIELIRYGNGEIDIDDARFEYLMRIMTPPECLQ